jgi:arylsulfatase A-like enzyme
MINRDVLGWLADGPSARPFFMFINYYDVHMPYVLHGDPDPLFGLATLPLAEQAAIDKNILDPAAGTPAPANATNQRVVNDGFALHHDSYDGCIANLDRQVGLLIDEIERLGLLENTLVIVTSDHGEQFGEHGVLAHGTSLYRPEVHVPLLVIPPSSSSRVKIVNEPVSMRDIPATVAEWVGLGLRNPFSGLSLIRYLRDHTDGSPEALPVLCELEHSAELARTAQVPSSLGPVTSLDSRDQVYIVSDGGRREELYDLMHDPQSVDLSDYPQSRPVIDRFRAELSRLCRGLTPLAR